MPNFRRIAVFALGFLFFFTLIFWPRFIAAQTNRAGNLIGYIYEEDGTTPVMGAVIRIKNLTSGSEYESEESDKLGAVVLNSIEEGLYTVGILTREGGFNIQNIIGIKANETAKVSFALRPLSPQTSSAKKKKRPRGNWYYPEVLGKCDEGYRWNSKTLRCEWKTKGIGEFLASPVGVAAILGATVSGAYGVIKLTEKEEEVSPFK